MRILKSRILRGKKVSKSKIAIIETGSKQYKVEEGTILDIETVDPGKKKDITFDNVLLVSEGKKVQIGTPFVKSASVTATILENKKDPKVTVFKFKPKTGYQKKQGHRQNQTTIKIKSIKTALTGEK